MTYALLTRMPVLDKSNPRLACVRHAASVRPEPGSNSPLYINESFDLSYLKFFAVLTLGIKAVNLCHESLHGSLTNLYRN